MMIMRTIKRTMNMGFHFLTDLNFGCIVKMPLLPSHPSPSHRRGWGLGGPSRVRTHWWTILRPSQRGLEFCDHFIQPRFRLFQVADCSAKTSSTRVSIASQYASSSSGGSGTATSCNSTARDSSCIHWVRLCLDHGSFESCQSPAFVQREHFG